MVNVEIRNTESSSTAAKQSTSVSDVRKRPTRITAGKARKHLTYDIFGEPVDDDTMAANQSSYGNNEKIVGRILRRNEM